MRKYTIIYFCPVFVGGSGVVESKSTLKANLNLTLTHIASFNYKAL